MSRVRKCWAVPPLSLSLHRVRRNWFVLRNFFSFEVFPWIRRLVVDLSLQSPWAWSRSLHVGFGADKPHWNLFFYKCFIFPLSLSFHKCFIFFHSTSDTLVQFLRTPGTNKLLHSVECGLWCVVFLRPVIEVVLSRHAPHVVMCLHCVHFVFE
jgi:hypothetical protein